ncbi:MAG TPA: hypothetical protein VG476_14350 [Acidimicrobiales bacterium]|nr:hypothetical protein [Acidimicrobiales bacterium]
MRDLEDQEQDGSEDHAEHGVAVADDDPDARDPEDGGRAREPPDEPAGAVEHHPAADEADAGDDPGDRLG